MEANSIYFRPKYTDNEIAKLFREHKTNKNETSEDIARKYNVGVDIIYYIEGGKVNFTMSMMEIASDYTGVPISELTEILYDDNKISLRGTKNSQAEALIETVNFLFDEMIMQKKLSI